MIILNGCLIDEKGVRMIKIRKVYYVTLIFGLALILIGCQDAGEVGEDDWVEDVSSPTETEEDTELILRHAIESEEEINLLRDAVENVEANMNATITMDPQGYELYEALLEEEISEGELPHIIEVLMTQDRPFIEENKDNFLDLTDYLEESGLIDSFYSIDTFTIDGRIYGLPTRGSTSQLFYNKQLVEELGGVPTTWDELVTLMKEASQKGYNPLALDADGYRYYELFEGLLSQTVSKDRLNELINNEAKWTDDDVIKTFELLEEIAQLEIPLIEPEEDGELIEGDMTPLIEAFSSGNTVFIYADEYIVSLQGEHEHMEDNIGVISIPPVPGFEDNTSTVPGSFNYGFVFSGHVTEAEEQLIYEFIESFWTEAVMSDYSVAYEYIPSIRMNVTTDNRLFQDVMDLNNEAASVYPSIGSLVPYEFERIIFNAVKGVTTGNLSVMEAVEVLNDPPKEAEFTEFE